MCLLYFENSYYAKGFVVVVSTESISALSGLEEELQEQNQDRRYEYKINTNLSYGFLKNKILDLFFDQKPMGKTVEELKKLFLEHQVPIRPNRSYDRKSGKYRSRIKPRVTKNQKDSI